MPFSYPKVSVLTIHRGPAEALERLAGYLAAQSYPFDQFEWIVVDDDSPENPPIELTENSTSFNTQVVQPGRHVGRARARNLAMQNASGEIYAFIDSDMQPVPTWIEAHARAVDRTDAVIVGRYDPGAGSSNTSYTRYAHTRGGHKLPAGAQIPGKYFVTNNCALPKQLADRAGGFDEGFRYWGGEDLEYGLRLEQAGASFYYEPRAKTWQHFDVDWPRQEWRYLRYGGTGVMRILKRYPEAEKLLSLDKLRFQRDLGLWAGLVRPALLRTACHQLVYRIARAAFLMCPRAPWPDRLFDYMIFYLYSRAFHWRLTGRYNG